MLTPIKIFILEDEIEDLNESNVDAMIKKEKRKQNKETFLNVVFIFVALPPLFLSFIFEAKVTTTFVSIRKHVYSRSFSNFGNLTVIVPIAIYG